MGESDSAAALDVPLLRATETAGAHVGAVFLLPPPGPERAEILTMAAVTGVPASVAEPWWRVALHAPGPVTDAIRLGRQLWLPPDELARRYPRTALSLPYEFVSAYLPLESEEGDGPWGTLTLLWPADHPPRPSEADRAAARTSASRLAAVLRDAARSGNPVAAPDRPRESTPPRTRVPGRSEALAAVDFADRLPEGACGLSLNGRVTFANTAAARLLGVPTPADLLGPPLWERLPWLSDPDYEDRYRAAVISGTPITFTVHRPPSQWLRFTLSPDATGLSVRIRPTGPGGRDGPEGGPGPERAGAEVTERPHAADRPGAVAPPGAAGRAGTTERLEAEESSRAAQRPGAPERPKPGDATSGPRRRGAPGRGPATDVGPEPPQAPEATDGPEPPPAPGEPKAAGRPDIGERPKPPEATESPHRQAKPGRPEAPERPRAADGPRAAGQRGRPGRREAPEGADAAGRPAEPDQSRSTDRAAEAQGSPTRPEASEAPERERSRARDSAEAPGSSAQPQTPEAPGRPHAPAGPAQPEDPAPRSPAPPEAPAPEPSQTSPTPTEAAAHAQAAAPSGLHVANPARVEDAGGRTVRAGALYRLVQLAGALAEAAGVQDVVELLAMQVLPAFDAQGVVLFSAEGRKLRLMAYRGYEPTAMEAFDGLPMRRRSASPATRALLDGEPSFFSSPDELEDRYPGLPRTVGKAAWAYLPLIVSGRPVGCCILSYDRPHHFSREERTTMTSLGGLIAQALNRARIYDDTRQLAHRLQKGLLPSRLPEIGGLSAAARYLPATRGLEIGGDFYDVIEVDAGGCAGAAIGDVQGHNVTAAALMGQVRTAVHAMAGAAPGEVLERANRLLTDLNPGLFTSCVYVHLNLRTRRALLANAGHPPPLLRHPDGRVTALRVEPGPLLGVMPGAVYPVLDADLPEGSVLVLYTDGLIETPGEDLDASVAGLARAVAAVPEDAPVDAVADELLAGVQARVRVRNDDIALLVLSLG
ncbi:SpoIIE family protein phosphatase [Streptomyces sp. DSM 44917]|uniref:SpoIIE family protein phosphatase n=1 Tax=Streptomyces boetiae TaxID=3075541 RepID=A0ABU2LA59_9ACTN|nr:SpoIIE family protein phosphatase [Streptomyces sp. DSM 44917]MDT0308466.1 SpoIIE family protein phosphatase [Streptomyces sp. DSM 44917]